MAVLGGKAMMVTGASPGIGAACAVIRGKLNVSNTLNKFVLFENLIDGAIKTQEGT